MKTYAAKAEDIEREWYVVSANGEVLGRMAVRIAKVLRGKHKPIFTPHVDCGDHVIVTDADKVRLTGRKWQQKMYYAHSGYPSGLKVATAQRMMDKHPEKIIRHAVRGMLPHNRLGRQVLRKLKVYVGPEHPHEAQSPQPLP
ncbi:MAG: 50S ribosomal protein L13 [Armatimonadetes bacterium]|jgi:large subunit ribosomal protein L13|nr:50S ribosomal protein L13 [Armatimonadota bacterium]MDI9602485.1 50S ribosomal protein L13 [Acidobacteriota bacterium]NLN90618.1 50S ribosomal protein L13 [candidate division WS1 bacterium]